MKRSFLRMEKNVTYRTEKNGKEQSAQPCLGPLTLIYAAVGLKDTHSFEWCFLQKFLSRTIVKKIVFLVQSIGFLAVF